MSIVDNIMRQKVHFKRPRLLVEEISNSLREAIASGKLKQGEKLSEPRLQRIFETSRSPIREALGVLEREGLVIRIPRKGAYVSDISLEELNDTTVVVASLEGLAARLAVPLLTEWHFSQLDELIKEMEEEVTGYSINGYTITHCRFHEVFVSACGNKILIDLIGNLRKRYVRPRVTSYYFMHDIEHAVSSHVKIIDALRGGDPQEAENAVKDHILTALIDERAQRGEKQEK